MSPGQEETWASTTQAPKATSTVTDTQQANSGPGPKRTEAGSGHAEGLTRVEQQRVDATAASDKLDPLSNAPDEQIIRRDTAALYARLVRLEDAGKLRWDDHRGNWRKVPMVIAGTYPSHSAYTEDELLDRFDKARRTSRGWTARCPAHEDRSPSLSISVGHTRWLIKGCANCDFWDIVAAASLETQRMVFPK